MVLSDARGGKIVIVTASAGFTDPKALQVLTFAGEGAAFMTEGGMMLGPRNVRIGTDGSFPTVDPASSGGVAIGPNVLLAGLYAVAIGTATCTADDCIAIGDGAGAQGLGGTAIGAVASTYAPYGVAVGRNAEAGYSGGTGDNSVGVGSFAHAAGVDTVAVGHLDTAINNFDVLVGTRLTTPINGSGPYSYIGINSVSDAGGGSVTIHASFLPAGLVAGQGVNIRSTTSYNGSFTISNVTASTFDVVATWVATETGLFTVSAMDGYNIYVGVNILDNLRTGNADTHQVAIGTDIVVGGSRIVVIGASAGSSTGVDSSIVVGASANVSHSYSQVYGAGATSTANNQVVFGLSVGATPGLYAVHQFVVRGYNGAALNTLSVIDNPVDSGDPNLGVTGLTVVYIQNSVVTNQTLKAALLVNLPPGALVTYF